MNGMIGDRFRRWLRASTRAVESEATSETGALRGSLGPDGSSGNADNGSGQKDAAKAEVVKSDSASKTEEQSNQKVAFEEASGPIPACGA